MNKKKISDYSLNIVTYHYVREVKKSKFPDLKALEFKDFKKQVNFFRKNCNIISNHDLVELIKKKKLPKKPSILLTFDDGYIDHYNYVFPYLNKKKIPAIFYPPVKTIQNKLVLDPDKLKFILAKEPDRKKILKEINLFLLKKNKKIISNNIISKIDLSHRFDDKETMIIKRLLQYYFPENLRLQITSHLFKKIIGESDNQFAKKVYMSKDYIVEMNNNGMAFGSHGDKHYWWEYLSKKKQDIEISKSINFYKKLKIDLKNFSVCYPYGSYNKDTINLMKKYNISFALSTRLGIVNNSNLNQKYIYPRLDANDFRYIK